MDSKFRMDNTEGYTQTQLDALNAAYDERTSHLSRYDDLDQDEMDRVAEQMLGLDINEYVRVTDPRLRKLDAHQLEGIAILVDPDGCWVRPENKPALLALLSLDDH
uniref:Uncharacterized protein n=1 Tax=viral metagenome TaxID=1070528 RepID=A0A6M3Y295_9ZZZZ